MNKNPQSYEGYKPAKRNIALGDKRLNKASVSRHDGKFTDGVVHGENEIVEKRVREKREHRGSTAI